MSLQEEYRACSPQNATDPRVLWIEPDRFNNVCYLSMLGNQARSDPRYRCAHVFSLDEAARIMKESKHLGLFITETHSHEEVQDTHPAEFFLREMQGFGDYAFCPILVYSDAVQNKEPSNQPILATKEDATIERISMFEELNNVLFLGNVYFLGKDENFPEPADGKRLIAAIDQLVPK
ncbi:MAG: hypothetical protein ABIH34_06135 [Nanoarchaeota archaeon]